MSAAVLITPFAAFIGLAIGSFLNVVAYRVPNGLSPVRPASACPGCGTEIRSRDNVPVLSWLLLRGRCRACRMSISARYPIVEAITGAAFVGVALVTAPPIAMADDGGTLVARSLELVALLYLAAVSIALAAIDLDVHRLPNAIVYPSYAVGAVLLGVAALLGGDPQSLGRAAIAAVASIVFYFVLAFAYPGGMGMGDVRLAGVLGLYLGYLGWSQLAVGVSAAFVLGGTFAVILIAAGRATRGSGIPFGPWMLVGTWVGIAAGAPIADTYLSLVGLR